MESQIVRLDSAIDRLIPKDAVIEKLAGGFTFTEGPIWWDGLLLFSDIPENAIYGWRPKDGVTVFRKPSGYDGKDAPAGAFIGSNGLTLDSAHRLVICEHGNRQVTRLEQDHSKYVLAAHFQGKRLNSPNDLVYRSDGTLYFTDPPYGLVGQDNDPAKELSFNGLFMLREGELKLLYDGLTRPNGLAFSPDESVLYVGNSDSKRRIWMRFPVNDNGTLGEGTLFADLTDLPEPGAPDGMKVDTQGNLYCTGPGGIHVFTPGAARIGVIVPPELPANLHWGDADASMLYITARTSVYRIQLTAVGIRP